MQTFRVELGANSHSVHIGGGILADLGKLARDAGLKPGRSAVVTDSNVANLYAPGALAALAEAGFAPALVEIPAGEASKSLAQLERLYTAMTDAELDRTSVVFALGGGVVGDLAGFAASSYLRGIPLVHVPTTLLAQVDSSLGGKTGVNHPGAKNLIGSFYQPRLVVADVATLKTLPDRELREGLAEVIKYGAIMDEPMLGAIEESLDRILARDVAALEAIVERSLRHKASIVAADERESDLRRILNFGHTIGHALEASAGYGTFLHGEAVAVGMVAALRISCAHCGLHADDATRLVKLIDRAGLPTTMPKGWRDKQFERALRLDKKRTDGAIEFVLLERLGHATTKRLGVDEALACLS
ncbi:MAG: 3-dehydroquinate synthase [Candidatus Binataceae bacterium]